MGGPQARAAYGASGSETKESRVPGSARTPAVLPVPGAALSSEEGLQHARRWGYLSQVSSHSSLSQHVFEQAWKLPRVEPASTQVWVASGRGRPQVASAYLRRSILFHITKAQLLLS